MRVGPTPKARSDGPIRPAAWDRIKGTPHRLETSAAPLLLEIGAFDQHRNGTLREQSLPMTGGAHQGDPFNGEQQRAGIGNNGSQTSTGKRQM